MSDVYRFFENGMKYVLAVAGGAILGAFLMWAAQQQAMIAKTAAHTRDLQECVAHFKDYVDSHPSGKPAPSASAQQERIDELTAELSAEKKRFATLAQQTSELITRSAGDAQVARSVENIATVLYEPAPPGQLQTVAQAMLIVAGKNFTIPSTQNMRPRWYIPGKVTPILYGAASPQDQYIWVDAAGRHAGPFPAQVFPAAASGGQQ